MENTIRNTIKKHNLIDASMNQHVVLGLSGGPDSLCLFNALYNMRNELGITLHPVHINHQFRPGDAEKDQDFVQATCMEYGLQCRTYVYDCNKMAKEQGISSEEAGRNARYEAFYLAASEIMEEYSIGSNKIKIAVAQNKNDQAETLLMRIIRGTGIEGLAGIEYERPGAGGTSIIRPLLDAGRDEIEKYCDENNLNPRVDHTNKEPIYTRNKIRLELIPYIEENFNRSIIDSLNRLSAIAKEDKEFFDELINEYQGKTLTVLEYRKLNPAIGKRLLLRKLEEIGLLQGVASTHIEAANKLIIEGKTGTSINLPNGYKVTIAYNQVEFTKENDYEQIKKEPYSFEYCGLKLRTREPGDYIYLPSIGGRKKIQNLYTDLKIKRTSRDLIPLLCKGSEVKWVIGDDVSKLNTGLLKGRTGKDFIIDEELKKRIFVEFDKKT